MHYYNHLAVLLFGFVASTSDPTIRYLNYGAFRGARSTFGDTINFFNIPYAASPTGALRFKPPTPPINSLHLGIQDATQPGPACMVNQKDPINTFARVSEDCLGLNVFLPGTSASPGANLPVFVCKHALTRRCLRRKVHRWIQQHAIRYSHNNGRSRREKHNQCRVRLCHCCNELPEQRIWLSGAQRACRGRLVESWNQGR